MRPSFKKKMLALLCPAALLFSFLKFLKPLNNEKPLKITIINVCSQQCNSTAVLAGIANFLTLFIPANFELYNSVVLTKT